MILAVNERTGMSSGVIDTLKLARALRDNAHFSAEDAEGAAAAIAEAIQSDLVTKSDLRLAVSEIRTELRTEIGSVRTEMGGLRTEMSETKYEIIKWVVGIVGFQAAAMIGAAVALFHLAR
jgi:hypothetical protein